jgi:serine/threonine protein kinase
MTVEFVKSAEPIPGYKLIEPLGRGGFGEVWKVEAPGGLAKAMKLVYGTLRSGAGGEEVLVQEELKALDRVKSVRHPYILAIEDSLNEFSPLHLQLIFERKLVKASEDTSSHGLPDR